MSNNPFENIKLKLRDFAEQRDWDQFHSPKNLSMDISVEASELMEKFLWMDVAASYDEVKTNAQEIRHELADVVIAAFLFAEVANIDISDAVHEKIAEIGLSHIKGNVFMRHDIGKPEAIARKVQHMEQVLGRSIGK